MSKYKALLVVLLLWSLAVTSYAAVLSLKVAELSQKLAEARALLQNATRILEVVREEVGRLGNVTGGISVEVEVDPPGSRSRVSLWSGATALDALSSVADVSVRNGRVYSVNGVEGDWRVYVVRGGSRLRVKRPGSFRLSDGDLVVACTGC